MPSIFESSWFDYPVKRNISLPPGWLRHFNVAVLVVGIIYSIIITVVNVALVGYETKPVLSGTFIRDRLWYERFTPKQSIIDLNPSWNCSDSIIKINEGQLALSYP
jgi:hypothetical protein